MTNIQKMTQKNKNSTSYQIIYQGNQMTESEMKKLIEDEFCDLFKNNSLRLREEITDIVISRIEKLTELTAEKILKEKTENYDELKNPDFQYILNYAQKSYARTGEEKLLEILSELIKERFTVKDDLKRIVLNEAIETMHKLTPEQIEIISLIFIIRYTISNIVVNFETFRKMLNESIIPFAKSLPDKESIYSHIEYSGCGKVITFSNLKMENALSNTYIGLFQKGFIIDELGEGIYLDLKNHIIKCLNDEKKQQINSMNESAVDGFNISDEMKEHAKRLLKNNFKDKEALDIIIKVEPKMEDIINKWNSSSIKSTDLTSVGRAIAIININNKTDLKLDMDIWI